MNCTWLGCAEQASHDKTSKDGAIWARLCDTHEAKFNEAVASGVKGALSAWVKAQGGAKAAADRMTGQARLEPAAGVTPTIQKQEKP